MSDAKIEIRTKDVDLPLHSQIPRAFAPQHLFIIHTDSEGKERLLRGGPERPEAQHIMIDDLKIIQAPYEKSQDSKEPIDYAPNAPSVVIASGTDAEMQALVDKMWAKAEAINKEGFDYKLPIGHVQNSNTAVAEMVKAAGLELRLPTHHSRIQVN